jgi:hypothetical protein
LPSPFFFLPILKPELSRNAKELFKEKVAANGTPLTANVWIFIFTIRSTTFHLAAFKKFANLENSALQEILDKKNFIHFWLGSITLAG